MKDAHTKQILTKMYFAFHNNSVALARVLAENTKIWGWLVE